MTTIQEQLKALKEQEKLLKIQLKNSEKEKIKRQTEFKKYYKATFQNVEFYRVLRFCENNYLTTDFFEYFCDTTHTKQQNIKIINEVYDLIEVIDGNTKNRQLLIKLLDDEEYKDDYGKEEIEEIEEEEEEEEDSD